MNYVYTGKKLTDTREVRMEPLPKVFGGQDGTVMGDCFFRFDGDGSCYVYHLPEFSLIDHFFLEKSDILKMHCNAVDFGLKYSESDEFPLVYINIYNSYSKEADPLLGVCGVYRLFRENGGFRSSLVQVIRIGFVSDSELWCSAGKKDIRPFGNFTVDRKGNQLIAFTMRDEAYQTRVFSFSLPDPSAGIFSEIWGVPVLTLEKEDIRSSFNGGYSHFLQGACCHDGKLYSTEGFNGPEEPPCIRIFDLQQGCQIAELPLFHWGFELEAECIAVFGDGFLYSDGNGNAWKLSFICGSGNGSD